jgi:hypothetical protein
VWASLESWRVQDGQFRELAVGDTWDTRLEVNLDDAEEVAPWTVLGLHLVGDPLSPSGPQYEIVACVQGDDVIGMYVASGEVVLAPASYWPDPPPLGTIIRFHSDLAGSESLESDPPDPLIRTWTVRRLIARYTRLVPDRDPNSWVTEKSDVRFREIERMQMWTDENNPFEDGRRLADYLLEIDGPVGGLG